MNEDVVGIFDTKTFAQLFQQAKTIKASVKETAKVMQHPVEDGSSITDHRIIEPIEIDMAIILNGIDYKSVYETIRQNFLISTIFIVQTRTAIYPNMIISAMPHEETAEMYDAISIAVKFSEVKIVKPAYTVAPKAKKRKSTKKSGKQQPNETPDGTKTKRKSILSKVFG